MDEGRLVAEGKAGEYLSIPGTLLGHTNELSCHAIQLRLFWGVEARSAFLTQFNRPARPLSLV
jgi:hypothetical protein